MLQSVNAVNGQNILDICLNTYGNLDQLVKLMTDNGHASVNALPVSGVTYNFDNTLIEGLQAGVETPIGVRRDIYATDGGMQSLAGSLVDSDGIIFIDSDNTEFIF